MSENSAASDWAAARGERWRAQLDGMEAMLTPVDEPLIAALRLDGAYRIAEVGCGGGGATRAVARRAPAGSVVHGFDIAPGLVEAARRRVPSDDRALRFDVADMAKAAPDAPYDRLFSRFGVMFFDDAPAAFANLSRWLAPRGRFAFAVWGAVTENPWMTTVREVVAGIVELPQPDPTAPGPFRYGNPETLRVLLAHAGFTDLDVTQWRGALPLGGGLSPASAAQFAVAAFAGFGELLAKAGDAALAEARQSLTARFAQHQSEGAVRLDACVQIFTGARP